MATQITQSPTDWDIYRTGATPASQQASGSQPASVTPSGGKAASKTRPVAKSSESSEAQPASSSSEAQPFELISLTSPVEGASFRAVDINKVGAWVYDQQTDGARLGAVARISTGAAVCVLYFFGEKIIVGLATKRLAKVGNLSANEIRVGAEIAETAAQKASKLGGTSKGRHVWAKLQEWSTSAAKKIKDLSTPKPAEGRLKALGRKGVALFGAGVSVGAGFAFISEIGNWFADAMQDFALRGQYFFDSDFKREEHFGTLVQYFDAGQKRKRPGDYAGSFVNMTFTPSEFIGLLMLASEDVVGGKSFDPETTRLIINYAATAIKVAQENNRPLMDVIGSMEVTLPVASPDKTVMTPEDGQFVVNSVRALITRFTRKVQDIGDTDAEDIIVPLTLALDRLTCIPGVLSKLIASIAFGSDVLVAQTFGQETEAIIEQITNGGVQSGPSMWEKLFNLIRSVVDAIFGDDNAELDPSTFLIEGGVNVREQE